MLRIKRQTPSGKDTPRIRPHISLRYKLALPVSLSVFLILLLLTHTTIRLVREFVVEAFQDRIVDEVESFTASIKPDFLLQNFGSLQSHLDWLAQREEVYGVRIVDKEGLTLVQSPVFREFPFVEEPFLGVKRLFAGESLAAILLRLEEAFPERGVKEFPNLFLTAAPLRLGTRELGRVQIFFTTHPVNETIRSIYRKRILFSFLSAFGIALLTALLTWVAIRPLFEFRKTVQRILTGHPEARALLHTGDEIQEVAEAFNGMMDSLQQSLKNLRSRTEALEESQERYRAVVENASDIIWLLSPDGNITYLNQGFLGLPRETLLQGGLPLFLSFLTEDSIQKFESALEQVKERREAFYHLATVSRPSPKQGEIFYSTHLTPVLVRGGELKAIQAVTRDVTELKRVELMKDQLIRDVAHELKTPVAKFQMTLDWLEKELQKEHEEPRYQEVLDLMKRNADLLMDIIQEVMDLSRLEAGTERLVRKPCDLNQILAQVCDDQEALVQQKGLVLEKNLSRDSLPLEGDEAMLYRLFSNLVANAVKFTPQGKIVVTTEKDEGKLRVRVRDTGVGLEKEDLEKVFDRFFQKTPALPGMGIGLALVREIAVLHGGQIWAESEGLGKGSTFIVEFS